MKKLRLIIPVLTLLLLSSAVALAQGRASMKARSNKVEEALKSQIEDWISYRKFTGIDNIRYTWGLKGTEDNPKDPNKLAYTLNSFDTPTEAYEYMHSLRSQVGPGKLTQEYGDETEIWDGMGPHGETRIYFRIGSEVVLMSGPKPEITKRFARLIADALADH